MPRILSRHDHFFRRKTIRRLIPSTGSHKSASSSSSSISGSVESSDSLPFLNWPFNLKSGTAPSSVASSARCSPSLTNMSASYNEPSYHGHSRALGSWNNSSFEKDSWGQFVDTAEAEEEIIRHSKILSKRYSIHY